MLIESKLGQRIVGLVLLLLAATGWGWHTAVSEGYYYRKFVAIFPALAVAGLGLLIWPIDVPGLRKKYGIVRIDKLEYYPTVWKVLLVISVTAGLANWYAISEFTSQTEVSSVQQERNVRPSETETSSGRSYQQELTRLQTHEGWVLTKTFLFVIGVIVLAIGLIWHHLLSVIKFFGERANSKPSMFLVLAGLSMVGIALLIQYLER